MVFLGTFVAVRGLVGGVRGLSGDLCGLVGGCWIMKGFSDGKDERES